MLGPEKPVGFHTLVASERGTWKQEGLCMEARKRGRDVGCKSCQNNEVKEKEG